MEQLIEDIISFFKTLVDAVVGIGDFIVNIGDFVADTILGLLQGIAYIVQATTYVTGFSSAVPQAIFAMFMTMMSLSLIFFIIGRVK